MLHPYLCWTVVFAIAALGCNRGDPDYFGTIKPLHPPDEVWINNQSEPEWIDPGKCSGTTGGEVIRNTFAGLTEVHPKTLVAMPDLAERWDISDDAKTYTFFVRDAKWSDGTPCTAHDFEWSWKRVLDPKTASKYSIIMYPFRNAAAFNRKALVLRGVPDSTPDEDIRFWAEAVAPVESISRDGSMVFLFLPTGESDESGNVLSREQIVDQLNQHQFGDSAIQVSIADASLVGIRAVGDRQLVVELEHPVPYFLSLLGFYTFMPVPRHIIQRIEESGQNPDLWTRPEHFVCNGPYKLIEWKFRQQMLFEQNKHYWNADAPHLFRCKRVKVLMVESYNSVLNLYCAGEVDWMGAQALIPAEFMDVMREKKDFRNSRYLGMYFYWFNTAVPPTDNPLVRKALSLAVDRQQITDFVTRAGQIPMASMVPDGLAGYRRLERPLFDPEEARRLLAEAGYPGGQGMPKLTLIYNTTEQHRQVASAVQQMWKDHLGIQVNIENQEWNVYLARLKRTDFQIARLGWIGDYADPNTFLELFHSDNGNNHSNWSDPKYDQMLTQANKTLDADARMALLREAEAYVLQRQPVLPLYVYTKSTMVKPYLRGLYDNDMDRHQWKYFWIDEAWYQGKPFELSEDHAPPMVPFTTAEGPN